LGAGGLLSGGLGDLLKHVCSPDMIYLNWLVPKRTA
jgi:hypothetical protein